MVLQGSVGNGLRAIDLLLRVEAMRCDIATKRTLPKDLQKMMDTLQEWFRSPGTRHTGPGHHYHNIQTSDNAYSHNGDNYIYYLNGAPPSAHAETFLKKLDETGWHAADWTVWIDWRRLDSMIMSLHDSAFTRFANDDDTSESSTTIPADVQPCRSSELFFVCHGAYQAIVAMSPRAPSHENHCHTRNASLDDPRFPSLRAISGYLRSTAKYATRQQHYTGRRAESRSLASISMVPQMAAHASTPAIRIQRNAR